jgi:hypothetical protein
MSSRALFLVAVTLAACADSSDAPAKKGHHEPRTAKEKQRAEAMKAKDDEQPDGRKWGGWRYQGERDDCFFVIGRRCFKTQDAACAALKCKSGSKCEITGGGPATASCSSKTD